MTSAGYDGSAALVCADHEPIAVDVRLRGGFEPIDGRYHWWGRIQPCVALDASHRSGDQVRLRTPEGEVDARISDVDPWGRFRGAGTGAPPFATSA